MYPLYSHGNLTDQETKITGSLKQIFFPRWNNLWKVKVWWEKSSRVCSLLNAFQSKKQKKQKQRKAKKNDNLIRIGIVKYVDYLH